MGIASDAMVFARKVHAEQKRKYTGNPYFDHLAEVAGIISTVASQYAWPDHVIATAWLHDCVEDHQVEWRILHNIFGIQVADGVFLLSDRETEGNRATRKAASIERLSKAPAWVQSIKCADLISNTSSIVLHDPKFAVTYLEEKRLLLDVLTKADPRLLAMALHSLP